MTEQAIRLHKTGGPEVLTLEDVDLPPPGTGEVTVRHMAIGVNFIETYVRSGLYPVSLPSGLGTEAAGVVEAVAPGVEGFAAGDRVAYCTGPHGSYATARNLAADKLIHLPDHISFEDAAALMLQGLTVWYLLRRTYAVKPGETVLWHAAAGGVGLIACQWTRHLGVRMIGTAGSPEKAGLAKQHGCAEIILYREEDVTRKVRELTGGKGVPVVYDSVGKDTWDASLDSLSPRGLMVTFGNSSGAVPPFSPGILSTKGSLYVTRPTLATYIAERKDYEAGCAELFGLVKDGVIKPNVRQRFSLAQAAEAHEALAARTTIGSTILVP